MMMILWSSKKPPSGDGGGNDNRFSTANIKNRTSHFLRESALSLACVVVGQRNRRQNEDEEGCDPMTIASAGSSSPSSSWSSSSSFSYSHPPTLYDSQNSHSSTPRYTTRSFSESLNHNMEVLQTGIARRGDDDHDDYDDASFASTKIEPDQIPKWACPPRLIPKEDVLLNNKFYSTTSVVEEKDPPPLAMYYIFNEESTPVSPPIALKRVIPNNMEIEEAEKNKNIVLQKGRTVKSLLYGTQRINKNNKKQDTPNHSPAAGKNITVFHNDSISNEEEEDEEEEDGDDGNLKWGETILKKPPTTIRVTHQNPSPYEDNNHGMTKPMRVVTWRLPSIEDYHSTTAQTTSTTVSDNISHGVSETSYSTLDVFDPILEDWEDMEQQHQLAFLNCHAASLLCD